MALGRLDGDTVQLDTIKELQQCRDFAFCVAQLKLGVLAKGPTAMFWGNDGQMFAGIDVAAEAAEASALRHEDSAYEHQHA